MKLWKDNKVSGEYELTADEIADGFMASGYAKVDMPLDRLVPLYIGTDLASSFGPSGARQGVRRHRAALARQLAQRPDRQAPGFEPPAGTGASHSGGPDERKENDMEVKVYLSTVPTGYLYGYREGDPMRLAISYTVDSTDALAVCEAAFHEFNVGDGELARRYRAEGNRSLSVGDLAVLDGIAWACQPVGWERLGEIEVKEVAADEDAAV